MFAHGLFGQGRNWTQIGKALADPARPDPHRVLLVDLPHHGRSAWEDEFDYVGIADRVAGLLDADDPVALVGHSLGGKVAMVLALRHPDLVERLCVVDVSPVAYDHLSQFERYIAAMRGLDLGSLSRRDDADAALADAVPDPTVRGFLLQNLRRDGDDWRWQVNLDVLARRPLGDRRMAGGPAGRDPAVPGPGAVGRRRTLRLRDAGVRRGHGPLVPHQPARDDQAGGSLGALRAAGGVPRGAPTVPRRRHLTSSTPGLIL